MAEIKSFTRARERIQFQIDDDVFEAAPVVPAETLVKFANAFADVTSKLSNPEEQFETITSVLRFVLLPESYAQLSSRFTDLAKPVDMDQLSDIILWLLEQYGMRPTQPSSNSSSGPLPPESGTSSTATTPAEASTSSPSLSTVS